MKKKAKIRLHSSDSLTANHTLILDKSQSHYVYRVMRAKKSDEVILFNGKDGEWLGTIISLSQYKIEVKITTLLRKQFYLPSLTLCFAPVKNRNADIIRQATEMGVTNIQPIHTEHTVVHKVNLEKFKIYAIEAAEQCERLDVPTVSHSITFNNLNKLKNDDNNFIICDERYSNNSSTIETLKNKDNIFLIIGPEGGFAKEELEFAETFCQKISLGSRILKVDTAVVCALSYINLLALNKFIDRDL